MAWSSKHTRKGLNVRETPTGKGVTAELKVTVYDNGMIEIAGTPIGRAHGDEAHAAAGHHDETLVFPVIAGWLTELYRAADEHRAGTPVNGGSR
jgi:hypothetical protein